MTPNASEPVTRDTTIGSPSKKGDVIDRKGAPPDAGQTKPEKEGPTGIRGFLGLLWKTVYKFFGDGCPSLAAALSFYTFFSLPALLALLLTLVGTMVDPAQVRSAVVEQVGGVIGQSGADQIATIIARSQAAGGGASLGTGLSLLVLAFGATTAFGQLQASLNKVWGVKPDPRRNQIKVFLIKRVFSFGVVITVAFLLLISLAVSTALAAIGQRLAGQAASSAWLLELLTSLGSFAVSAGLFAVMFRYLPDARIGWRDVRAGAIGAAVLFVLGKSVIGMYLGGTNPGSAYGAAGSLAVVLIWVYYTSMILFLGAEFTEEWARHYGRGIVPEKGAVAYVEEEKAVAAG
ncbi:MAG TPA: YihY/virulence factor BrkB family protein [Gemmatimonadaceae bacterium]|nr:YihY/virulence factor BrkB family protein [Gemmatimonadaceae bacterium]